MNKTISIICMLLLGIAAYGLEDELKSKVDQALIIAANTPVSADVQIEQISKMGGEAFIYALPQLIKLNGIALKAGSENFTLALLTKSAQLTDKIPRLIAEDFKSVADLNDERHRACIRKISINVQE